MFIFGWINSLLGIGGGGSLNRTKRMFLPAHGAGSGVHNRIVLERAYNRRALNLVRASFQCASITDVAQTGLDYTGDFYVMANVKLASNIDSMDLFDKWEGTGNQRSFIPRISATTGQLELYISPDGTAVTSALLPYTFPAVNTKFHICFGYKASEGKFQAWINGASIGTQTGLATSIFNSSAPVSVGALLTGGTQAFNGVIDHLKTGNIFPTTADVLAKMDSDDADGEMGYWRFDGDLTDSSGNGNNLSPTNAPTYTSPLFGSNIYLPGEFTIAWKGFISDQEEGSYGICGADELVALGQIKVENNTIVVKTESDQTGSDIIDFSAVNVEDSDAGLPTIILSRNSSNVITMTINDVAVGNTATVAGIINIQQLLGSPVDTTDFGMDGGVKDLRVWSRDLTSGEKTTIHAGGHIATGCEYYMNTNTTSGTSITDLSGNLRTGTLANAGANFFFSYIGNNLFTSSGFSAWGGAFPNELPTNWASSGVKSTTNYTTEKAGKLRLVSDGTNLGFAKNSVLVEGQRYKAVINIKDIYAMAVMNSNGTNPSNGQTLTIGATVYTFKTVLASAYDILIGADAAATLDNVKSAVNKTAGEGTTYGTGTLIHPTVEATDNTNTIQSFVAKVSGSSGSSIGVSTTSGTLTFTGNVTTLGLGSVYFFNQSGNTSILVNVISIGEGWNVWPFTAGATANLSILRLSGVPADNLVASQCLLFKY